MKRSKRAFTIAKALGFKGENAVDWASRIIDSELGPLRAAIAEFRALKEAKGYDTIHADAVLDGVLDEFIPEEE